MRYTKTFTPIYEHLWNVQITAAFQPAAIPGDNGVITSIALYQFYIYRLLRRAA